MARGKNFDITFEEIEDNIQHKVKITKGKDVMVLEFVEATLLLAFLHQFDKKHNALPF
ncbi:MAG: hypothetical protein IPN29_01930 [Saprospiraceae bacterium]|nr:hypothetical protein [Saprospiraceae bacterium]